jgi:acyl-coenzyme A thioesterase 13
MSYGVGDEHCFGHVVGKTVKFLEVNVGPNLEKEGRLEASTVAEITVTKSEVLSAYPLPTSAHR